MSITMYAMSVPVFIRALHNLGAFLEKGRADAEARGFAPGVLVDGRLAPDMHKLSRQVQIACDTVKNAGARLAGIEAPSHPDTETDFGELQARIANTVAFLETLQPGQLEGSGERRITLKFPGREMSFVGADYLSLFVLPNFYFHMTTAYNILRHNGVKIGKSDFVGT